MDPADGLDRDYGPDKAEDLISYGSDTYTTKMKEIRVHKRHWKLKF